MLELWSKKLLGGEAKLKEPVRFDYTGAVQTFVVPSGIKKITVDCVGARGGVGDNSSLLNLGGRVECSLSVTPGETLYIYVGGSGATSGYNGGENTYETSYAYLYRGGGASDIRTISGDLNSRLIVAGGSGSNSANSKKGGNGGGLIGAPGVSGGSFTASGGTQTSGGVNSWLTASNGSLGEGGPGGSASYRAGSGGGGWYGGAGGTGASGSGGKGCTGGGGGSSYTNPDRCSDVVHTQGYSAATGNGWIILS